MGFINTIRIQNFKSLEDVTLNVKALNLFFGPNSSGKSSALKAILFLNNNLFPLNQGKLKYKISNDTDLISYSDIILGNDISKDLIFELNLSGMFQFYKNPFEYPQHGEVIEKEFSSQLENKDTNNEEFEFKIVVKFVFNRLNGLDKLSVIDITDVLENNAVLRFHNIIEKNIPRWLFESHFPDSVEFNILNESLCGNSSNNYVEPPFSMESNINYNLIKRFENILADNFSLDNATIKNSQIKASRLYYLYYVVLPAILKGSLLGYHLSTIRQVPCKKYYMDDDNNFNKDDYYGYLNDLFSHQQSIVKFYDAANIKKPEKSEDIYLLKNFFDLLNDLKLKLSVLIDKYMKGKDTLIDYNGVDDNLYIKYLFYLFWVMEELVATKKISTYDDLYKFYSSLKSKEDRMFSELNILFNLEKEDSEFLYKLFEYNDKFKNTLKYFLFPDNRNPNFYYNLSVSINKSLSFLGFNSFVAVLKSSETGFLSSLKNDETQINLSSESSGLQQILPVLITLVYVISDSYLASIATRNKLNKMSVLFNCFSGNQTSINFDLSQSSYYSLFVEQPELHLHPKLQCKFAEYLSTVVESFIPLNHLFVETHSEHIVRMMQVLVAKNKLSLTDISISYFDISNEKVVVKDLRLSENGSFLDPWPNGFFDEASELSLELLKAQMNRSN